MPLAATLATDAVFQAFQGPSKLDALLHGHSYAGNPISCAVACEALAIYEVGWHGLCVKHTKMPAGITGRILR